MTDFGLTKEKDAKMTRAAHTAKVSHGLQLQSMWIVPAAAVS